MVCLYSCRNGNIIKITIWIRGEISYSSRAERSCSWIQMLILACVSLSCSVHFTIKEDFEHCSNGLKPRHRTFETILPPAVCVQKQDKMVWRLQTFPLLVCSMLVVRVHHRSEHPGYGINMEKKLVMEQLEPLPLSIKVHNTCYFIPLISITRK